MNPERNRLLAILVMALLSIGLAAVALYLELNGGSGRRMAMLAGAPLVGAALLVFLSGKRR